MNCNNRNESRAACAGGCMALCAVLAMGLGSAASPAEAAPFAYVTNSGDGTLGTVSVIDTATNPPSVVATVVLGGEPERVAVTPDGKHVYVAEFCNGAACTGGGVEVIDTATNTVMATGLTGTFSSGVAVTPDGQYVYVTNEGSPGNFSVIATATNTVVAGVTVGGEPNGVAVTPDGKHAYVANNGDGTVSVIDTASNTVVATVPVGSFPGGVAVTPDSKHVYVANSAGGGPGTVSVIDTATNTVVGTPIPVGTYPIGVAVTPDGQHVYVANDGSSTVSVIATATNTVETTVAVPQGAVSVAVTPDGKHVYVTGSAVSVIDTASNTVVATAPVGSVFVGIVPPPPGVPFLTFNASLDIAFGTAHNQDAFTLGTSFTLSHTAPGFNPLTDPVILQIGTFAVTFPPGSFQKNHVGDVIFTGVINGVTLEALIKPTGTLRYAFQAKGVGASFTGTQNPVYVTLALGGDSSGDSGATSVTAQIFGTSSVTAKISH